MRLRTMHSTEPPKTRQQNVTYFAFRFRSADKDKSALCCLRKLAFVCNMCTSFVTHTQRPTAV